VFASAGAVTTLSSSTASIPAVQPRSFRTSIVVAGGACLAIATAVLAMSRGDDIEATSGPFADAAPDAAIAVADALTPDHAPDLDSATADRMRGLASSLRAWAIANAGAPCPRTDSVDGWDRTFVVTCARQPEDQQFGIVSLGVDGVADTADDIVSWQRPDVRDVLRGSRWRARALKSSTPPPRVQPAPLPARPTPSTFKDENADGIPDCRSC
jgi:hypothetical protein